MGIEPTWDSPHCPTPDLKSGSPTSELGTSGRFITKMANHVDYFWHGAWGIEHRAQGAKRKKVCYSYDLTRWCNGPPTTDN